MCPRIDTISRVMGKFETSLGGKGRQFPETLWSQILSAKDKTSTEYHKNLDYLVAVYWKPVYTYIRLRWKKTNDEAKDLTQEFFTNFLERDFLKSVSPERGKFRTFVRLTLERFLSNVKRSEAALKRGGQKLKVSFDGLEKDTISSSDDPEKAFLREWAKSLLDHSMKLLRKELEDEGKGIYFEAFNLFNSSDSSKPVTYLEIANELGIKESNVRSYLFYTRKLLKRIIRKEVEKSINNPAEADEEMHYLLSRIKLDQS